MIILASTSPRRKQLLASTGLEFSVVHAKIDEESTDLSSLSPHDLVLSLARLKAQEVLKTNPDAIVIGADTMVVLGNKLIGKPKDEVDALRILKLLRNKTHQIFTGVCIISKDQCDEFVDQSEVTFTLMKDADILEYIKSGEPLDKAGAYGIQTINPSFIKKLNGDIHSIMGLPLKRTLEGLKTFGVESKLE